MKPLFHHRRPAPPALTSGRAGMTLLITVIILGSVALAVGLSVAMRAIGERDSGLAVSHSDEAYAIADACMDDALIRLGRDGSYAGGAFTVGQGSCLITVGPDAAGKAVTVTGTLGQFTRKIRATAAVTGTGVLLKTRQLIE